MKNFILSASVFIVLALGLSSCGDDEKAPLGTFTFDGKTYKLDRAFTWLDYEWVDGADTYYDWFLLLTSKGIRYDANIDDFEGAGDAIGFLITAANDDSFLPEGTYTWNEDTADCDGIYIGINLLTGDGDLYDDVEDVTITLTVSDDTYTIEFTIDLFGGEVVTGSFTGKVTEII